MEKKAPRISLTCRACLAVAVSNQGSISFQHTKTCPFHPDQRAEFAVAWLKSHGEPLAIGVESVSLESEARSISESCLEFLAIIPKENIGDIRQQLKKSCLSIASNISEGLGRKFRSNKDCQRFFAIALGSTREAITQFSILSKLRPNFESEIDGAIRNLHSIREKLEAGV